MEAANLATELREIRDDLVAERRLIESDSAKAQESKKNMLAKFAMLDEAKIQKLENANIFVRELLAYDLDRAMVDKEYMLEYHEKYITIINQIKEVAKSVVRSR